MGTDALLMGSWREAIIAAVACEQAGRAGRYADGPAGQVLDFMMEKGHTKFAKAAEKTEEAAHAGRIRPAGKGSRRRPNLAQAVAVEVVDLRSEQRLHYI